MMVAAFTQEEVLRSLQWLPDPRLVSLKLAYSIPGYADATRETKNYVYDAIRNKVLSLMEQ